MSYQKYNFEVIAEDNNSPFFRNYIWTKAFYKYRELLDLPRVVLGINSVKNNLEYLGVMETWVNTHNFLKDRVDKNYKHLDELIDITNKLGESFNRWSDKNIFKANLKTKNSKELIKLLNIFADKQAELYAYGVVVPILDFMNFSFVENNLVKILKKKIKADKYSEAFSAFTYPVKDSFSQEETKNLLKIMIKYWQKESIWQNLQSLPLRNQVEYFKKEHKGFYQDLKSHCDKYTWVYYAYNGPVYDLEDFLGVIKDYLIRKVNPSEELKRINKEREGMEMLKEYYIKKIKPSDFELHILNLAGKVVWAKPRRKDYQSKSYYHAKKLLTEFGRRLYMSPNQVSSTPFNLIEDCLINNKAVDIHYINDIYKHHVCLPNDDGTISILVNKKADNFSKNKITRKASENVNKKTIKGDTACPGKVQGLVRIINTISDLIKMNYGDILVSNATSPNIVSAMKKASAIITNEGGLTCHAAIVSRELNKPCVINTRVATKALKDGDEVVVDASKGIIKIIK